MLRETSFSALKRNSTPNPTLAFSIYLVSQLTAFFLSLVEKKCNLTPPEKKNTPLQCSAHRPLLANIFKEPPTCPAELPGLAWSSAIHPFFPPTPSKPLLVGVSMQSLRSFPRSPPHWPLTHHPPCPLKPGVPPSAYRPSCHRRVRMSSRRLTAQRGSRAHVGSSPGCCCARCDSSVPKVVAQNALRTT